LNLNQLVLGQVVVEGRNQGGELDAVLFHRNRFGDGHPVLLLQDLLQAAQGDRLAAAHDTADRN